MPETLPEHDIISNTTITIGSMIFDLTTHQLRAKNGVLVSIRSQSAEVLALLAKTPGEIVTKETLFETVWNRNFVTDDSLTQCIADIRKVLGDTEHTILQTYPKKGYILNSVESSGLKGPNPKKLPYVRIGFLGVLIALVFTIVLTLRDHTQEAAAIPSPSIAVLAFDDLSVGDDKNYLSDAISEGIITELSRFPEIFVIARNSSFKYKGQAIDIRDIAKELGVRYILEGSLQKEGNRLRVTAQLIDAIAGNHIWAERYDRDLANLFVVQDEITRAVAASVGAKIMITAGEDAKKADPARVTALLHYLKARRYFREFTREGSDKARLASLASIEADPTQPYGHYGLAWTSINGYRWGWTDLGREEALADARASAQTALTLAPNDYEAHFVMANVLLQAGELDQSISRHKKALELNPNATNVMANMAEPLVYADRPHEAIELLKRSMRLDPHHPDWVKWNLAWAQWYIGNCEQALATMLEMSRMPNLALRSLAIIYVCLGRQKEAENAIADLLKEEPDYSIAKVRLNFKGKYKNPGELERWIDGLRTAGLPE